MKLPCKGESDAREGNLARCSYQMNRLLNQPGFCEKILLELRNIVQSGFGILLASNGKVELILLLGEQFKELWNMPHVFLPIQ